MRSPTKQSLALTLLTATVLIAPDADAQTIVTDGADLQAVIDSALPGDVIELQSNGTFAGVQVLETSLTIRAGAGFSPTIAGPGALAPEALSIGASQAGGSNIVRFEGVTFTVPAGDAVRILGAPAANQLDLNLGFSDCVIGGNLLSEEALGRALTLTFDGTTIQSLNALRPNAATSVYRMTGSSVFSDARFRSPGDLDLVTTVFRGPVVIGESADGTVTGDIRRCIFLATVEGRSTATSAVNVQIESSLFERANSPGTGVAFLLRRIQSLAFARLTNCTFRNYEVGIGAIGGANIEGINLLFDGNADDIAFEDAAPTATVRSSLIPDGTFAGLAGNVQGTASFGCGDELIGSTLGVDLGNPLAPGLGALDLLGAPRIQDGDGDGTAIPNVGAVESIADFGATAAVFNGTGINPVEFAALTAPTLGTTLELSLQTVASTVATAILIDVPAAVPFPSPLGQGEIHIQLGPALISDFLVPGGAHNLPLPAATSLLGQTLRVQGLRVDLESGIATYPALNSLDLDFGDC